jgi:galactokinase
MRFDSPEFVALFGAPPKVSASAPGRVNLLGEHTDYNDGLVLPTAIPQRTRVDLRFRDDRRVRVVSTTIGSADGQPLEYELGSEAKGRGWLDYVQGVTWLLHQRGFELRGFDMRIRSQIPLGSGLSSSAAMLVAMLRAFSDGLALPLSDIELARLAQRVENEFVGAPVGILDPMACGLCEHGSALFLDTRSLQYERLPLPRELELVVIHSGIAHAHAPGESQTDNLGGVSGPPVADYRARRVECERAANKLGLASLRDISSAEDYLHRVSELPAPLDLRVRHVLTENERVRSAATLLREAQRQGSCKEDDLQALGALFAASHRSQRDDFGVSTPELDLLVEIGASDPGIVNRGARLTGGGFGGSVVMLARAGEAVATAARVVARYRNESGKQPTQLLPELGA